MSQHNKSSSRATPRKKRTFVPETVFGLSVAAAGAEVGFHPESIRRAVREGRIGAVRAGGILRIPREELRRLAVPVTK